MKTAVVLFNLGGPSDPKGIYPFLLSLFSDPAIIALPNPFRLWLARYISWKRTPKAQEIFNFLGGKSPLLKNTHCQAEALEAALGKEYKVFVMMRHAPPFAQEVISEVQDYDPCEVVLLPLYPQFSTTTTGSSLKQWFELTQSFNLSTITKTICCYPTLSGFAKANADLIEKELFLFQSPPRLLFSAHGLPEKIVKSGDPYVCQIAETAALIVKEMSQEPEDWVICYQSRVGLLPWTKPDLESEIRRAAQDQKGVLIIPLSFVSEHSETLVELDITLKELAQKINIPAFRRVPTVFCHPLFIQGLVDLIKKPTKRRACGETYKKCWRA